MSGPAQFILRGRLQATVIAAIGAVMPPLFILSAAGVSLVTLRKGLSEGGLLVAICTAAAAVVAALSAGSPAAGIVYGATLIPCIYLGEMLRRYVSLRVAIIASVAMVVVAVLTLYLVVPDPAQFWQQQMTKAIDDWRANGAPDAMLQDLVKLAEVFPYRAATGMILAGMLLTYLGGLFLGRAWQAAEFNPGGFRREFAELQLGRGLAIASCACFILSGMQASSLFLNLAVILLVVWLIQGLAVLHGIAAIMKLHWLGMAAVYLALLMGWWSGNVIVLLVPLLGIVNQFFDLRLMLAKKK